MGIPFRLDDLLGKPPSILGEQQPVLAEIAAPLTRPMARDVTAQQFDVPKPTPISERGPIRRGFATGVEFGIEALGESMRAAGRAVRKKTGAIGDIGQFMKGGQLVSSPIAPIAGPRPPVPATEPDAPLADWLEQQGDLLAVGARQSAAEIPGPEKRMTEIRSIDDAVEWAAFTVSQGVASSLPSLAGGVVGGLVAGPAGAIAGAMGPGYILNQQEVRRALLEEGIDEDTAERISGIAAVPMAMLDVIVPARIGTKMTAPLRKEMTRTVVRRFLQESATSGLLEGVTEAGQATIERVTTAGTTGKPLTRDDLVQVLEEGVAGGLTGMFLGGAGQTATEIRRAAQAPTEAETTLPTPPSTAVVEDTRFNLDDLLGEKPASAGISDPTRIENLVLREGIVDEAATKAALPPQPAGTTRLYRAESPTVSFEDVWGADAADFPADVQARAKGLTGKFYTSELRTADYFRQTYGRDARVTYIDVPNDQLAKFEAAPGEFVIDVPGGTPPDVVSPPTPVAEETKFSLDDLLGPDEVIAVRGEARQFIDPKTGQVRGRGPEQRPEELAALRQRAEEEAPGLAPEVQPPQRPTPPPVERIAPEEPTPAPEIASLKKAEGAAIRERLGLEELEPATQQSFQAAWDEAKGDNLAERATDIAQEAAASRRPLTATEHAGAVQRYLELERDLTDVRSTLADAVRQGNDQVTQQLSIRSDRILDEIDALTEATDRTGSEAGRALSIRRLRANVETFTLASGLQMARSRKGGSLAPQEVNKIEELTGQISTLEEQNTKLRTENDELEQKRLKAIAEQVVRVEAKRKPRGGVAARLQERQVVLQQLSELGLRLNDISGVSAEGLFLIGKLTVNTIREAVARTGEKVELGRIVDEVLAELNNPEIRPRDIHEALNARDPKRKQQQASDAAQQVRRLKTHARLIVQVEDAEAGLFAPSRKRPIAPAEIRKLQKRLTDLRNSAYRAGLRPERLERAVATLNELQDQLTNHFRNIKRRQAVEVTPELEAIQAKIRGLRQEMRVEDLLADLNEQLRTGDFKTPKRRVAPHISPQLERNQIALKRAQRKWRDAIERMAPLTLHRAIGETTGFLRTMKATADMSATMRQAFWLSARRPIKATKVFGRSVIAFFSEFTADEIDNAIRQHPNQLLRDRAKLTLTERGGKLSDREEMFTSNLAEQLPVFGAIVRASNQSMTTTLNLMRVAAFDQFLELYPNATTDELQAWASWVNIASGRGNLGRLAVVGNELSLVFFAPRFAVSRIQTPFVIFKFWRLPRVRKEIAKDYAAVVAVGLTALGLAALAGLKVGLDPRDSDFGKIRIGNTRIDIWGGVQQPVRLLARIMLGLTDRIGLTGRHLTKSEKEVDPLELLGRFSAFKIAPSLTIPLELYRGTTAVGEETTPGETAIRSILPIIFEDVFEASRDGFGRAALAGGSAFLGLGVSTFGDDKTVRGGPRAPRRPQPPRLPIRR